MGCTQGCDLLHMRLVCGCVHRGTPMIRRIWADTRLSCTEHGANEFPVEFLPHDWQREAATKR